MKLLLKTFVLFSEGLPLSFTPAIDDAPPMNKHEYQNSSLLALCLSLGYFQPSKDPTVVIEFGAGKNSEIISFNSQSKQTICPSLFVYMNC